MNDIKLAEESMEYLRGKIAEYESAEIDNGFDIITAQEWTTFVREALSKILTELIRLVLSITGKNGSQI